MTIRFMPRLLLGTAFVCAPLLANAVDGFYIETVNRGTPPEGGEKQEQISQTWITPDRMKVVNPGPEGNEMIMDPGAGRMTVVNHAAKAYMEIDLKAMMQGMSEGNLQQMQSMMGEMRVQVADTGETRHVGDWDCKVYKVSKTGMMAVEQEICASEAVAIDVERFQDMMNLFGSGGPLAGSSTGAEMRAEMAKVKGYPILTKSRMTLMGTAMEVENEVRVIRREDIPATAFEIPAGYAKRELGAPEAAPAGPAETN